MKTTLKELKSIAEHKNITVDTIFWILEKVDIDNGLEKDLRLFACDCAERVLPIFERKHPNDPRISSCIKKTRAYIFGDIGLEEVGLARKGAVDAVDAVDAAADTADTAYAAYAAAYAAVYAVYAADASHAAADVAAADVAEAADTSVAAYAAAAATDAADAAYADADIHYVVAKGEERKTQKAQLIEIIAKY